MARSICPRVRNRISFAFLVGFLAVLQTSFTTSSDPGSASDFDQQWIAARAILADENPYDAVIEAGWAWPFYYPLTAPLAAMPLATVPRWMARGLFVGISAGLLAFAVTRSGWWGALVFLSPAFLHGYYHAQWTPLLTAVMLLPALSGLLVAKPSVGLAMFASRPTIAGAAGAVSLVLLSLVVRPTWPGEWLEALRNSPHLVPPIFRPGGFLLLAALAYWRRPEARLLAALACVPHLTMIYETLPLFTIPRTFKQMAALVILTSVGAALMLRFVPIGPPDLVRYSSQWPYLLLFSYLPALGIVLHNGSKMGSRAHVKVAV